MDTTQTTPDKKAMTDYSFTEMADYWKMPEWMRPFFTAHPVVIEGFYNDNTISNMHRAVMCAAVKTKVNELLRIRPAVERLEALATHYKEESDACGPDQPQGSIFNQARLDLVEVLSLLEPVDLSP